MENYCAFSKDHKCLKWEDYELARHELEEADRLCHGAFVNKKLSHSANKKMSQF